MDECASRAARMAAEFRMWDEETAGTCAAYSDLVRVVQEDRQMAEMLIEHVPQIRAARRRILVLASVFKRLADAVESNDH